MLLEMKRTIFYIDGFNLYFGIRDAGYSDCKWLDIMSLCRLIKNVNHELVEVKYFTSAVNYNAEKQKRQNAFLEALRITGINPIFGQFRSEETTCKVCAERYYDHKEKKTDVNIATHLLIDAYEGKYDVAFLISGDSDLVPPIQHVKRLFPNKEIIAAFPPSRSSSEISKNTNSSFKIGYNKLKKCQLPFVLENKYGDIIRKPNNWS